MEEERRRVGYELVRPAKVGEPLDTQLRIRVVNTGGDREKTFPRYGVTPVWRTRNAWEGVSHYVDSSEQYLVGNMTDPARFAVNLGDAVISPQGSSLKTTPGTFAVDRPAVCLCKDPGLYAQFYQWSMSSESFGLIPKSTERLYTADDHALRPYLPGFTCLEKPFWLNDASTNFAITAVQDLRGPWYAKAKATFNGGASYEAGSASIACWPSAKPIGSAEMVRTGQGCRVYDGVDLSPEIVLQVRCPYRIGRYPNIATDNVFPYSIPDINSAGYPTLADDTMYDDRIGTLRLIQPTALPDPQGWRRINNETFDLLGITGTGSPPTAVQSGTGQSTIFYQLLERYE